MFTFFYIYYHPTPCSISATTQSTQVHSILRTFCLPFLPPVTASKNVYIHLFSSQSHQTPETKNSKLTSAKIRAAYLLLPPSIRFSYSGSLFKGKFVSGAQTERKTCFRFHSAPFMLNSFLKFCLLSHAASLQLSISAGYLALLSSSSQIIHCSIFFSCSAVPLLTSVPGG